MSESPLENVLRKHRESVDQWLTDSLREPVQTSDEFDSDSNRVRLAALRALDPSASLDEELTLRLDSPLLQRGALTFDAGHVLMRPLQESVGELAGDVNVELQLVGLSSGSTVLHVRPHVLDEIEGVEHTRASDMPVDATASETVIKRLLALFAAAEDEGDVRPWVEAVDALEKLSTALDQLDARLDLTWSGVSGDTRSVTFSSRGRNFVHSLMRTEAHEEHLSVQGRVTELKESGVVKVKTGTARNSPAFDVRMQPEQLLSMRLSIGDSVAFRVRQEQQVDRLQQPHAVEYFFEASLGGFSPDDLPLVP